MYEEIYASARALGTVEITEITQENAYVTADGKALPPFTRVKLVARPTSASDIRIELWLPKEWNGLFLGTGNGGMAGVIRIEKLEQGLLSGCATAHTDMGTSDGVRRGVGSKALWEDFGWRSTKIMTDVGKALTRAHYGKEIEKSYFIGNSTGGQQALMMAQRFPEDYDGIVAGVPVTDRIHLHTYFCGCTRRFTTNTVIRSFARRRFTRSRVLRSDMARSGEC
jgi:feruloyl esterase